MSQLEKLLFDILGGTKDSNISFSDLRKILQALGFDCRIKGDHFIYTRDGIDEILNLQPIGNKAKAHQVKQVRNVIIKHHLGGINHV